MIHEKIFFILRILARNLSIVQSAFGKDFVTARQGTVDFDLARIANFVTLFATFVILFAVCLVAGANLGTHVLFMVGIVLYVAGLDALVTAVEADVARMRAFGFFRVVSAGNFDFMATLQSHLLWELAFDLVRINKALDSFGLVAAF